MVPFRFHWLAQSVLALLLALTAVNPIVPEALARTTAESLPDADDDCDTEFVAPISARQAPAPERRPTLFASSARAFSGGDRPFPRAGRGTPVRSADPLGARL